MMKTTIAPIITEQEIIPDISIFCSKKFNQFLKSKGFKRDNNYLFSKNSILKAGISFPNHRRDTAIALVQEFTTIGLSAFLVVNDEAQILTIWHEVRSTFDDAR